MDSTLTSAKMAEVEEVVMTVKVTNTTNAKDTEVKAYTVGTILVVPITTNGVTFTIIIVVKLAISSVTAGFLNEEHI